MTVPWASTSMYSQPISAARSTNFFCLAPSWGLGLSDHQLQATRPGLIQLVFCKRDDSAVSSPRADLTMFPKELPTMITRQGMVHGSREDGLAVPYPFPSAGSGNTM